VPLHALQELLVNDMMCLRSSRSKDEQKVRFSREFEESDGADGMKGGILSEEGSVTVAVLFEIGRSGIADVDAVCYPESDETVQSGESDPAESEESDYTLVLVVCKPRDLGIGGRR
jgi:hypothetical protein